MCNDTLAPPRVEQSRRRSDSVAADPRRVLRPCFAVSWALLGAGLPAVAAAAAAARFAGRRAGSRSRCQDFPLAYVSVGRFARPTTMNLLTFDVRDPRLRAGRRTLRSRSRVAERRRNAPSRRAMFPAPTMAQPAAVRRARSQRLRGTATQLRLRAARTGATRYADDELSSPPGTSGCTTSARASARPDHQSDIVARRGPGPCATFSAGRPHRLRLYTTTRREAPCCWTKASRSCRRTTRTGRVPRCSLHVMERGRQRTSSRSSFNPSHDHATRPCSPTGASRSPLGQRLEHRSHQPLHDQSGRHRPRSALRRFTATTPARTVRQSNSSSRRSCRTAAFSCCCDSRANRRATGALPVADRYRELHRQRRADVCRPRARTVRRAGAALHRRARARRYRDLAARSLRRRHALARRLAALCSSRGAMSAARTRRAPIRRDHRAVHARRPGRSALRRSAAALRRLDARCHRRAPSSRS